MNHTPRRFVRGRSVGHKPGQMNKTEEAYAAWLATRKLTGEILDYRFESMSLKLGPDCRYTPDFLVIAADMTMECHEVKPGTKVKDKDGNVKRREDGSIVSKAFTQDTSIVKVRAATAAFPWIRFCVAYRYGKEPWQVEEVGA